MHPILGGVIMKIELRTPLKSLNDKTYKGYEAHTDRTYTGRETHTGRMYKGRETHTKQDI